jgi:hypothetical protein
MFPVNNKDARLGAKTYVWTISIDGKMKSYAYDALVEKGRLVDSFNNHELDISVDEKQNVIIQDEAGRKITGFRAFWFSVATHNPSIELWTGS